MRLPKVSNGKRATSGIYKYAARDFVDSFRGYNHNMRISDDEMFEMNNMTTDNYPCLSVRDRRLIKQGETGTYQGVCYNNHLAYVLDNELYFNSTKVTGLTLSAGDKQMIPFGAYIEIFPDAIQFNTADGTYEQLGTSVQIEAASKNISYSITNLDGADYNPTVSPSAPTTPTDGQYWLDTTNNNLKRWSATTNVWSVIATTYIKVNAAGTNFSALSEGDAVAISGSTILDDATYVIQKKVESSGTDSIVVVGFMNTATATQSSGTLSLFRNIPEMSYITQLNNRLWGCSANGHEIYACKLGDAKNWNSFEGLASDSYAVNVGSDGLFTGAVTYMGKVLFFKENYIHKVYGTMPSNYQTTETACQGVIAGSAESIKVVNEYLYYLSRNGVCRYDGSLPVVISQALGTVKYKDGHAGAINNKYYLSCKPALGEGTTFVYDASKGTWTHEWDLFGTHYTEANGELITVNDAHLTKIFAQRFPFQLDYMPEGNFEWMIETGDIGLALSDEKTVTDLTIRMDIAEDANVQVWTSYDGRGFNLDSTIFGHKLSSYDVPIKPHRCDYMRIRVTGYGDVTIYSIAKTITQGSNK